MGALNGRRRFRAQAGLDITFATLRTSLVLGLASTHLRVTGAIAGFAIASFIILLVALALHRDELRAPVTKSVSTGVFARNYARFFAPVLVYQLALNLVLQADLLVMKAVLSWRRASTRRPSTPSRASTRPCRTSRSCRTSSCWR
nr:hypothetical protein [Deltaproteobacteria bacterium]